MYITECYNEKYTNKKNTFMRIFKTSWFSKTAKKLNIPDSELFEAIKEVIQGQASDLGGGVFKKRLNKNKHRAIILAKGEFYWVYEFLFSKQDRDNIDDDELARFRILAKAYGALSEEQVKKLLMNKSLVEIENDIKA